MSMQSTRGCLSTRALLALAVLSAPVTWAFALVAQSDPSDLIPPNALVIERSHIPATVRPNRELLLWMIAPVKRDRGALSDNPYTCPELTMGSYYSGPTRLSLLDTRSGRVINTIKLSSLLSEVDEFNIPYRIISGQYYLVPGVPKNKEGKPTLLKLRDLNGDGIAAETAFFEAEACMGLPTTLIGYSVAQDKVIQYPAQVEVTDFEQRTVSLKLGERRRKGKPRLETQVWTDYLFSKRPVQPRHWKYAIDYRGRAGCYDSYDIRYDPERETFFGTLRRVCPPPDDGSPASD